MGEEDWLDVWPDLLEAASKLNTGELRVAHEFSLSDCLTVLELMSPKMDPGYKGDTISFAEKLHDFSFDPLHISETEEIIILLRLISLETTWLQGQNALSTIFTLTLFHQDVLKKLSLSERYTGIKAYLVATINFVELVHTTIIAGETFSEEDYVPYFGQLDLKGFFPEYSSTEKVLAFLEQEIEKPDNVHIRSLLQFKLFLLKQGVALAIPNLEGYPQARGINNSLCTVMKDLEALEEKYRGQMSSGDRFFDPNLYLGLLGPAPPRVISVCSTKESVSFFKKLVADSRYLFLLIEKNSLREIFAFLKRFSTLEANILVRSRMILPLFAKNKLLFGKFKYETLIIEDMESFGVFLGREDLSHLNELINIYVRKFYDILRVFLCNKSRIYRNLINLLESLRENNVTCYYIDKIVYVSELQRYQTIFKSEIATNFKFIEKLSIWSMNWNLEMILDYLLLGFELNLYGNDEVFYISYIVTIIIKALKVGRSKLLDKQIENIEFLNKTFKKNKKNIKNAQKVIKKNKLVLEKLRILKTKEYVVFDAIFEVFLATYYLTLSAIRIEKKFQISKVKYTMRFAKMLSVLPELPSFEQLEQAIDSSSYEINPSLLRGILTNYMNAKKLLKGLLEDATVDLEEMYYRSLLRMCIHNSLVIQKMMISEQEHSRIVVEYKLSERNVIPMLDVSLFT